MAATFHRLAAKEFREARDWYRKRSLFAAERFALALHHALDWAVADFRQTAMHIVRMPLDETEAVSYLVILHEVSPGELFVVAVSHTRRRPGYWRRRL